MTDHGVKPSALLFVGVLLSACSLAVPTPERQQGFFERTAPGAARCYAGASIARGGEARAAADSTLNRTVYMVLDTILWEDGERPAHIIGSMQSTERIGATWIAKGDSLYVDEWGVMPEADYVLREDGEELTGRAWMEHHTSSCPFNGACQGPSVSRWSIRATRIPCSQVPRNEAATGRDTLPG